jgi:glycosyltransferase involved in cell wall biosynthesis
VPRRILQAGLLRVADPRYGSTVVDRRKLGVSIGASVNSVATVCPPDRRRSQLLPKCESGVCMLGAFPPPVHGMAMVNAGMYKHLCRRGTLPLVLDLAPASLERGWLNRLGRLRKVAKACIRYLWEILGGRGCTLYVGLSGGWGQLYEALFVSIARLRGARIFLHHHSFAYLDRSKLPARWLVQLAGSSATHVVICETQGRKLSQCYPTASRTKVVSNAAIMDRAGDTKHRPRTSIQSVGFLGNISREKGILEVLAIAERLKGQGADFDVYIAGPFENATVESAVQETVARLPTVKYVGPRYGSEKESFWDLIDILLFPSQYSNETAPLVVHEAMAHGIPVIAWARGCLSDMVTVDSGVLVPPDQDFVAVAVEHLLEWQRDPAVLAAMSSASAKDFSEQHDKSRDNLVALLDELTSGTKLALTWPKNGINSH